MALDEDQINKVKLLLASSAWNDIMKPALANRGRQALAALALDPSERKGEYENVGDATLRARIREVEWLLTSMVNEVTIFDANRQRDELTQSP